MKLILATGIQQTDKNKLLGMAISTLNNGQGYKEFNLINFDGLNSVRNGFIRLKDVKDSYLSVYDDLENLVSNSRRSAFNLILDASFTVNTSYGYVPLITERFFSIFKPDAILVIENKLEDYKDNPRELYSIREQQDMNRMFCIKLASQFSIPVKIIKVNRTEIKSTVKEIQNYLASVQDN